MKGRPAWVYAIAVGVLAIIVIIVINVVQILMKPGAEEQMRLAVLEMRDASLQGKPGGVLEHMSQSFRLPPPYDSMATSSHLAEVGRWIRRAEIRSLEVTDIEAEVFGSQGVVHAHVSADVGNPYPFSYNGPIEINFRKEVHRRLFIIPEERWLVESFGPVDITYMNY
jgi:hypothetical protein